MIVHGEIPSASVRPDPKAKLTGGDKGGEVVFSGTPEQLIEHKASHTGRYLKNVL